MVEASTQRSAELKSLEFLLLVQDTEEHIAAISDMGRSLSLGRSLKPSSSSSSSSSSLSSPSPFSSFSSFSSPLGPLVEASLLSQSEAVPYFIWFHIDRTPLSPDAAKIFVHVHFYEKPPSDPPEAMLERRRADLTLEWFWEKLSMLDVQSDSPVLVAAELRLTNWKGRPFQIALAAPLLDWNARADLEICGAEYRSKSQDGRIQGFRWSAPPSQRESIKVWLSYLSEAQLNRGNIWEEEKAICVQHLESLL